MSTDKNYCMSSYLAFRYIEDSDKDFYPNLRHADTIPVSRPQRIVVRTAQDIDAAIEAQMAEVRQNGHKLGLLLSGGMDSAILASYMSGCEAYTFRFLGGSYQKDELERAEYYARCGGLHLHYVDIDWGVVEDHLDALMRHKCAPVHSIEPQIMKGALQAKLDGVDLMIIGDGSDYVFGGMDQLLGKDWTFNAFMNRYVFVQPSDVLREPADMQYLFERYRQGSKIDFLRFLDVVMTEESYLSYSNAFNVAEMPYFDPYAQLKMAEPLDLHRIRRGESKYLIRELFSIKYPQIPVPEKIPMPRPVDLYFADWKGPKRREFKSGLDMSKYTGNQRWQLYCLERFLDLYEPENE